MYPKWTCPLKPKKRNAVTITFTAYSCRIEINIQPVRRVQSSEELCKNLRRMLSFKSKKTKAKEEDFEELEFPPTLLTATDEPVEELHSLCRREPLQECDFLHLLDSSGRLMDEHKLRRAVFEGGLSPEARKQAWQFLFELYPFHSTTSERVVQRLEQHARYRAMKSRWREVLHCDADANELLFPDYLRNLTPQDEQSEYFSTGDKLSKEQLQMANTQAGIEAQRLVLDVEALKRDIRIIDKDVPRTDRDETYFQRETHMLWLRDVLITFCAMHPKTGYMQGMNDILARFLTVFDSEADAFWCLTRYIERMEADFTEEGILNKLGRARDLLGDLDNDLYEYLQHLQVADMAFCHSWLLLCFRRELSKDEGLRCFEIVSSHYLEVTSLRASSMFDDARRTGFEERGGGSHTSEAALCTELSLDVFMCITLLINNRNCLFECHDNADVFSQCNRFVKNFDVDDLLQKTTAMFQQYCQKKMDQCFILV